MKPGPKPKKDKMKSVSICMPNSMIEEIHKVKKPDRSFSQFIQISVRHFLSKIQKEAQ